jgi:hypothetical protein
MSYYDKAVRTVRLPIGIPPRSCGSVAHRSWQLSPRVTHSMFAPAIARRLCKNGHKGKPLAADVSSSTARRAGCDVTPGGAVAFD